MNKLERAVLECRRNKIKFHRTLKYMTQEDLAKKVGLNRSTIIRIENETANPTLQTCIAIAVALDCTLNDLFWEVEENE